MTAKKTIRRSAVSKSKEMFAASLSVEKERSGLRLSNPRKERRRTDVEPALHVRLAQSLPLTEP